MSNSEARVELAARYPMTKLSLVDSAFRVVVKSVGRLSAAIAPGVYELRATTGRHRHTTIISVRAGQSYTNDDVVVPFGQVTPAAGTSCAAAVARLSDEVTTFTPGDAGVVVLLLGEPGQALDFSHVEMLKAETKGLSDAADGWAGWSLRTSPGGHMLRYHTDDDRWVDVPLWLPESWQTLVFVPCPAGRPDPAAAVTHLWPLHGPWAPDPEQDIALELLLQGLGSRGAVPEILPHKGNPMVTLALAATLATHGQTDSPQFTVLMAELDRWLPGHPDVAALKLASGNSAAQLISAPPSLAALLWKVLLPADHAGRAVITPGSIAENVIPTAVPNGPWLAWRDPERSAELAEHRIRTYLRSTSELDEEVDARQIAQAVGLTTNCVRRTLRTIDGPRGRSHWQNRWQQLLEDLSTADFTMTVPGVMHSDAGMVLETTWLEAAGMARLSIESNRHDLEAHLAQGIPILLTGPGDVHQLVELIDGVAVFPANRDSPYTVRFGRTSRIAGRTSYQAVSLDPELTPAFGTAKRVARQRTVVARGKFELDTFEDTSRNIQLAIRSEREMEPDAFALVSVRPLHSDDDPEELAVPLTRMAGHTAASGALRLGPVKDGLAVFVVPDLVNVRTVGIDVLRRSLKRFANNVTRKALMRAVDLVTDQEADS
jgi:hypothetical protein